MSSSSGDRGKQREKEREESRKSFRNAASSTFSPTAKDNASKRPLHVDTGKKAPDEIKDTEAPPNTPIPPSPKTP